MFLPAKTKKQRRYEKMLELHKKKMEEYKDVPWTDRFSTAGNLLPPPSQTGAAPTRRTAVDGANSDSDFDPDSIKYCKEWDPEGIAREYDELLYKYRKESKPRRKKFVEEALAKKFANLAVEDAAEQEANAAAAAAADAAQLNRGAEIIAQFRMPKVPENYQPPLDESYIPFNPMVYTELPEGAQPQAEDLANVSILEEGEMAVDDVFGDDQIAIMERPERDLMEFRTPSPSSSEELLQENEMMVDDIFGENQMAEIDKLPQQEQIISEVINLVEGIIRHKLYMFFF